MKTMKKGFTLIELLVVIAIIGILAATVLVGMRSARGKARDTQRKSNVKAVINGLEMNYDTLNAYPAGGPTYTSLSTLVAGIGISTSVDNTKFGANDTGYSAGYYIAQPIPGSTIDQQTVGSVAALTTSTVYVAQNVEGGGASKIFYAPTAQ